MSSKFSANNQRIITFWLIVISMSHLATPALATITHEEYAVTSYHIEHISYKWEIRNFTLIPKNNGCITSLKFNTSDEHRWVFTLCTPLINNNKQTRYTTVKIEAQSAGTNIIEKISGTISIFASARQIGTSSFKDKLVGSGNKIYTGLILAANRALRTSKPDMSVTVQFEIDAPSSRTKIIEPDNRKMKIVRDSEDEFGDSQGGELKNDFRKLINEKKWADVEILVGDETFFAHKAILASRSPVFHEQLEGKEVNYYGRVPLRMEEINVDVMRVVLEYIYTDEIENLNDFLPIEELLIAASSLELPHLKIICSNLLKKELTPYNMDTLLTLAEHNDAEDLKQYVLKFKNDHISNQELL